MAFDQVVIDLDLAVLDVGPQAVALAQRIGGGGSGQRSGLAASAFEHGPEDPEETVEDRTAFARADGGAQVRSGVLFAQLLLDLVEESDLVQDPSVASLMFARLLRL